ncbi:hypothetical protein BJY18_000089 [Amycolatopsis jiangsuensis]|uniref:Uncharacterized protein n=1 Tax=Amycolatopsis jiangsuensis TaxID=1181879 RepID=A0A840INF2_9PSEU|nr:hypothetical protein [Amycolatopsis jiangsuensis]
MTVDAVAWMRRRDVSVYAGDIGDAHPGSTRRWRCRCTSSGWPASACH